MTQTQLVFANAKAIDANTVAIKKVDAKVEAVKQVIEGGEIYNTHFVRYDVAQTLTEAQKAQVRANIGADSGTMKSITVNGGEKQMPDPSGNVELKLNELLKDYTLDLNASLAQRMEQLGEALHAAFGLVVIPKSGSSSDSGDGQ